MKYLPYHRLKIYSNLSPEILIENLSKHVQKKKFSLFEDNPKYFNGEITNFKFRIEKNLSGRNSFNPIIEGTIFKEDKISIDIIYKLHPFTSFFVILFNLLLLSIIIYIFVNSNENSILIPFLFLVFNYLLMIISFNYYLKTTEKKLKEIFTNL
jgi:hypothetical protein